MPNAAPSETAPVDHGLVEVGTVELGGYTVDILTIKQPVDMSRMLRGLPGDACQCPDWGIINSGSMTVRYADGSQDAVAAGEAFYLPPGHVPTYEVGTQLTQFSPTEEAYRLTAGATPEVAARGKDQGYGCHHERCPPR